VGLPRDKARLSDLEEHITDHRVDLLNSISISLNISAGHLDKRVLQQFLLELEEAEGELEVVIQGPLASQQPLASEVLLEGEYLLLPELGHT